MFLTDFQNRFRLPTSRERDGVVRDFENFPIDDFCEHARNAGRVETQRQKRKTRQKRRRHHVLDGIRSGETRGTVTESISVRINLSRFTYRISRVWAMPFSIFSPPKKLLGHVSAANTVYTIYMEYISSLWPSLLYTNNRCY